MRTGLDEKKHLSKNTLQNFNSCLLPQKHNEANYYDGAVGIY